MGNNFQLIPKFDGNCMVILFVLPNGEYKEILRCIFPNDKQLRDNVVFADEVITLLRKRIKRSIG